MALFMVSQGASYDIERAENYIWSPKYDKAGKANIGYTTMREVKKGDFILHNANGNIRAISIAQRDCFEARKPKNHKGDWNIDGYRVDTMYFEFDSPLYVPQYKNWLKTHYVENSAFTVEGKKSQVYLCHIADEHAAFLIEKAIHSEQKNNAVLACLCSALLEIKNSTNSEYTEAEIDIITNIIENDTSKGTPSWKGSPEPKQEVTISQNGRKTVKRNPQVAANALKLAKYTCEISATDRTFLRKNGTPYTEAHHLIPLNAYDDFNFSLDIMENIVSLCSYCHNLLHYGRFEDKKPLLQKLYEERKEALAKCGIEVTLEKLEDYYKKASEINE